MRAGGSLENLWYGGLHIELRGADVEAAVFDVLQAGIELRQLRVRQKDATAIVSLRYFDTVRIIAKSHRVKIRFLERYGIPFWMNRLRRRKTMLLGPLLFVCIVYFCSSMIWQVNISGVKSETEPAVRQAAGDAGVFVGAWKWNLKDTRQIQDTLLQKVPDLIWTGVDFQGARANIDAIEKVKGIEQESLEPHDIVADKPAVIRQVYATRGRVLVKPGQVVHPGDVLITGNLAEGGQQVPAAGQVLAETWYTTDVTVSLAISRNGMTGRSYRQGFLAIGASGIHLLGWKHPKYADEVNRVSESDWKIGKWAIPVQWRQVTTYEVSQPALTKSETAARKEALQLAMQDVQSKIGESGSILQQTVLQVQVSHGKLYEKVWTKAEEDIGVAKAIPPNTKADRSGTTDKSPTA